MLGLIGSRYVLLDRPAAAYLVFVFRPQAIGERAWEHGGELPRTFAARASDEPAVR